MDFVKSVTLILVGVAVGFAAAWFMPKAVAPEEVAEVMQKLADLGRRVDGLERSLSNVAAPAHAGTALDVDQLREDIARLQAQVYSLSPPSRSPGVSESPRPHSHGQTGVDHFSMRAWPRSPEASIGSGQLEGLVAEVVASLAPRYLEEHVSQLYAAQKQADEDARQEAEQRRAQELRERRLAQLVTDLQAFVPGLMPFQVEEVARVISEQWEAMAAMRQQAWENGTLVAPGETLRRAREMTDEKLYPILSPPQLEAFRLWRETRFGSPASMAR
jgi:hypothetical protein